MAVNNIRGANPAKNQSRRDCIIFSILSGAIRCSALSLESGGCPHTGPEIQGAETGPFKNLYYLALNFLLKQGLNFIRAKSWKLISGGACQANRSQHRTVSWSLFDNFMERVMHIWAPVMDR